MCKTERQKAIAALFDAERARRKNNRALQKLLKINAELENASERRSRFRNRYRLQKDEKAIFEESEKRLFMLNSQSDIWADEQEQLDNLCKRRDKLFEILKDTNDQLIEEPVMKSMIKAAQQQHERLNFLHKVLKKNVRTLSKHLAHQSKLFDEYTEKEAESKEMMAIQDSYFRDLRKMLRVFNVANVNKKVKAEEESVKEEADKNHRLEEMIKTLRQQAINVPLLKYQFQCAVDEERRLKDLNGDLDKVIEILTERLSDQTRWETAYQDMDKKVKNLKQVHYCHLKKFEDLTGKNIKVGSESRLSLVSQDKSRNGKIVKRLHTFKYKINALQQECTSFQPKIERFLGDLNPYSGAVRSKSLSSLPPSVAWKLTGKTSKHREPEKFSEESSSETEYEESDTTDESTDDSRKKRSHPVLTLRKTPEIRAFVKRESEDESPKSTDSYSATDSSETITEDTSDCKASTDDSTHSSSSDSEEWWKEWWKYFF